MRKGASDVAVAVSLSRVAGLVRERFFAHYLGTSDAADAFGAALRIPGVLHGSLGERVLLSAFVPRHVRLLAQGARGEAARLAWAVASIHTFIVSGVVLAGVLLAPFLVAWIAPGFGAAKAAITVRLVRILFPAVGLLVLGSWCLGVLNSHRRFFLPYVVPVLSSASIVVALIWAGTGREQSDIAVAAAWGALVGALLQLVAQLPWVIRSMDRPVPGSDESRAHLRAVGRNALPAAGRGLTGRVATWIEIAIAGFVSTGAIAGLNYAQLLYSVPVGLFTVAISAALLPELSAAAADKDTVAARLTGPLDAALRHTAYLLVGCAVAFIALGDVLVALVYQGGEFTRDDVVFVWAILGAMSIGLTGSSMGGLLATAFYAVGDTLTPLKAALTRLSVRGAAGALFAIPVVRALGLDPKWGAAGLGAAMGISGWIEFVLLRKWLHDRIGLVRSPHLVPYLIRLWAIAGCAALMAWAVKLWTSGSGLAAQAACVLGTYSVVYVGVAVAIGMREPINLLQQLRSWVRR